MEMQRGDQNMGQYYDLINFDKKAILTLADKSLSKLQEFYYSKEFQNALINLLANDWKGDTVILLGDYADQAQEGTPIYKSVQNIRAKYGLSGSVQDWPEDLTKKKGFYDSESIEMSGHSEQMQRYRYLYNHALKQFIDVEKYPVNDKSSSAPFLLLIALGNGYGMGDITEVTDEEQIGAWVDTISSVTVEQEILQGNYKEIMPRF